LPGLAEGSTGYAVPLLVLDLAWIVLLAFAP